MNMSFRNVAPLIVVLLILSGCVNQRKATESNAIVFPTTDSLRRFIQDYSKKPPRIVQVGTDYRNPNFPTPEEKTDVNLWDMHLSFNPIFIFSYTYEDEKKFKAYLKLRTLCDYPYFLFY